MSEILGFNPARNAAKNAADHHFRNIWKGYKLLGKARITDGDDEYSFKFTAKYQKMEGRILINIKSYSTTVLVPYGETKIHRFLNEVTQDVKISE